MKRQILVQVLSGQVLSGQVVLYDGQTDWSELLN